MEFFTAETVDEVKKLIELRHDVNYMNVHGKSVLHYACEKGNLDIVKVLCEAGANVNKKYFGYYTPIYMAASSGCLDIVKYLIENYPIIQLVNSVYSASFKGHTDVLDYLLTLNLELNSRTFNPLIISCYRNDIEVVYRLLQAGANPNIVDIFGLISLVEAVKKNNLEIIKKLVMFGADYHSYGGESLLLSCEYSYNEISEFLIGLGCDVNCCIDDWTPLMYACKNNNLKIVKLLLERGANPDFVAEDGKRAIDCCTSDEVRALFIKN